MHRAQINTGPPLARLVPIVVLAVVGCATGSPAARQMSGPGGGAEGSTCAVELGTPPARGASALDQFVDSASFLRELERIWQPNWGNTLATLEFDPTGTLRQVTSQTVALDGSGDEYGEIETGIAEQLNRLLRVRSWPEGSDPTGFWIWVGDERGAAPRTVPGPRGCPPRFTNQAQINRLLKERGRVVADRYRGEFTSVVRIRLDRDGLPIQSTLVARSGNATWDSIILDLVDDMRFDPAWIEGLPGTSIIEVPLTLRAKRVLSDLASNSRPLVRATVRSWQGADRDPGKRSLPAPPRLRER